MPTQPYTLTNLKMLHIRRNRVQDSRNLMTRNARIGDEGKTAKLCD
jgi:hypothetical protein